MKQKILSGGLASHLEAAARRPGMHLGLVGGSGSFRSHIAKRQDLGRVELKHMLNEDSTSAHAIPHDRGRRFTGFFVVVRTCPRSAPVGTASGQWKWLALCTLSVRGDEESTSLAARLL
mmetsp:Transcript_7261/g.19863  ORF Transcript_7261/g.19863 Transcript_7261/m.19863 type:complete len:119 (+) Transcript_7261:161-517(+)